MTGSRRYSGVQLLQDVLSRIVSARESLEYGDLGEAAAILFDLELDIAGALEEVRRAA